MKLDIRSLIVSQSFRCEMIFACSHPGGFITYTICFSVLGFKGIKENRSFIKRFQKYLNLALCRETPVAF